MNLITILLIATAFLTLLTGLSILCGATKTSRSQAVWFFIATLGSAIWSGAIAAFLSLTNANLETIHFIVVSIIFGITLTDVALLGYTCWATEKHGKIITIIFGVIGSVFPILLAINPSFFYSDVTFGQEYNIIHTVKGVYFFSMLVYFTAIFTAYSNFITKYAKRLKNKNAKTGLKIFKTGLGISGILALVFDLILLDIKPQFSWIGPMAISISIITFYYSVIKYKIISVSGKWMEILSYILLIAAGIVLYAVIFYAIFTSIFRVSSPSPEILLLNFIMLVVVLCLMPAISEILSVIKSYLPIKKIDIGYITKKLNLLTKENIDIKELASFLATNLKLEYFGFLIKGKVYGSKNLTISQEDIKTIEKLKPTNKNNIWLELGERRESDEQILKIAEMLNEKDFKYGEALIGRPTNGRTFDKKELAEIEMIVKLASIIIDEEVSL